MTYIQKLEAGEGFEADLHATYGPETEKGYLVELDVSVQLESMKDGWRLSMWGGLNIKSCEKLGLVPANTGGQCLDSAVEYLDRSGLFCPTLNQMVPIWKEWHLNDAHAGTERQDAFLDEYRKAHPGERLEYEKAREILQENGVLEDDQYLVDGKPYEYGTKWMFRQIPHEILLELCGLCDSGLVIYRK